MQMAYVTYPGDQNTRFDRKYYVDTHLPLVLESWHKHGLESVAAFFPEGTGAGTIAICLCTFRDEQAMRASFAAPETPEVMADVLNFTDAKPIQSLAIPL